MRGWAGCATTGVPGRRRRAEPQAMLHSLNNVPWLGCVRLRKEQLSYPCKHAEGHGMVVE